MTERSVTAPGLCHVAGETVPTWFSAGAAAAGMALSIVASAGWNTAMRATPPPILKSVIAPAMPAAQTAPTVVTVVKTVVKEVATPAACFNGLSLSFQKDSAVPDASAVQVAADGLLAWLASHPATAVLVEGHADSTGTEGHNIVLSFARAKSVAALLAGRGIAADKLKLSAAGAASAVRDREMPGERRVALRFDGVPDCPVADDRVLHP